MKTTSCKMKLTFYIETTEVLQMVKSVREAYHTQIDTANEEAKQAKEFVSTVDALFTPEYPNVLLHLSFSSPFSL